MRFNLTAHAAMLGENASAERETTYLDPRLWSIPNANNISGFEIARDEPSYIRAESRDPQEAGGRLSCRPPLSI